MGDDEWSAIRAHRGMQCQVEGRLAVAVDGQPFQKTFMRLPHSRIRLAAIVSRSVSSPDENPSDDACGTTRDAASRYRPRARATSRRAAAGPHPRTVSWSRSSSRSTTAAAMAPRPRGLRALRPAKVTSSTPSDPSTERRSAGSGRRSIESTRWLADRSSLARSHAAARSGWRSSVACSTPAARASLASLAAWSRSPRVTRSANPCRRAPWSSRKAA